MIVRDGNAAEFLSHAGELLYRNEVENSLMIGVCERIVAEQNPVAKSTFVRFVEKGETVAAIVNTPQNLVLSHISSAQIEELTKYLWDTNIRPTGVVGPLEVVDLFAESWSAVSGLEIVVGMSQMIYRVDQVVMPKNIEGSLRQAQNADLPLLIKWHKYFCDESLPSRERGPEERSRLVVEAQLQRKGIYLWMVNSHPVSMAYHTRPTKSGITISAVYTPVELRKRGYASAVTAYISREGLNMGKKFCVLYTDLANPTSNKIYRNIGYRPVARSKHVLFV